MLNYVLTDLQGSVRAVMNNNGYGTSTVIARHDYLPFGEELPSGVGLRTQTQGYGVVDANRQKYAMLERDSTGLNHTWWRKYESAAGRWTSPDPLGGSIGNPQSFNRYSYAANDPVNFIDPSGLEWTHSFWNRWNPFWFQQHGFDASENGWDLVPGPITEFEREITFRFNIGDNHYTEYHFLDWGLSRGVFSFAGGPYVDQQVLNSCTEDYFGVTLKSFDESRRGQNGRFTATGPSYLPGNPNGEGGTATYTITNSVDYSNKELQKMATEWFGSRPPEPGKKLVGFEVPGYPLRNYTGSDNGPMQMMMTQVHELGHSLDEITRIDYDNEDKHPGRPDLGGQILEDCVRKRGGFRWR